MASLGVVLYHLESGIYGYQDQRPIARIFSIGGLGVPLFFVLSGFVISMAAVHRPRGGRSFLVGRIARLYPAYLATAGLVVLALVIMPGGELNHAPQVSWERLLRTLVFDFGQMGGYVYVGWTLFYEMLFYLMFAPLAARFTTFHQKAWFQYVVLAGLMACTGFALVRIGSFLMGVALFLLLDSFNKRFARQHLALVAGVVIFGFRSPEVLACGALLILLVLLEWRWRLNFSLAPMLRLGDASYSIYLVQVLTISASLKLAWRLSSTNTYDFGLLALVLGMFSTVVAGLAMHRWIERPGTRLSLRIGQHLLRSRADRRG